MYFFLNRCNGRQVLNLDDQSFFCAIIACAGHDVDHPGHNNLFEAKNRSVLATIYNDKSILENHHAATLFKIVANKEANILDDFSKDQFKAIRSLIIDLILATDMTYHFDILKNLKDKLEGGTIDLKGADQKVALQDLVHACDIGNPARPREIALEWTFRVLDEFFS